MSAMARRYRISLTLRVLAMLSAIAAFSTISALLLQERALSSDLQGAAQVRLLRAADATGLLVDGHLEALQERYRAISGTPQFRATLEVDDAATLLFYAEAIAGKEQAALIAFLDDEGRVKAMAGDPALRDSNLDPADRGLVAHRQHALAKAVVPLLTGGTLIGHLVALERIEPELLARFSHLCGATVSLAERSDSGDLTLGRVVRRFGQLELRVEGSMEAEREALEHARGNLLMAGGISLGLALLGSILVSRGVVRPILAIRNATIRIGEGDFESRFRSRRSDEIGDVARAFDGMLDRLSSYRSQVEAQRETLQENLSNLQASQEQLANAQKLAHIGSWRVDLATGLLTASDEFLSIFEISQRGSSQEKGMSPEVALRAVHPDDREGLESGLRSCISERATLRLDCRISLRHSPERVLHLQAELREDEDGRPAWLEGTVQDVTERRRSDEQIRYLAYHDSLTGLGNRLACRERLGIEIQRARHDQCALGVLFLDLDQFKRINDTLGHSQGDELLKGVADRLVASVRESDSINRGEVSGSISRLGGDEFTIMLPGVEDVQDLARVARRILSALTVPFDLGGHEIVIGGSIGITAFPFDGDDAETMLRNADVAMYHAKEQGRNNYQFYTDSMNDVAMERLIMEGKLRQGLERGEFELHYQPKVVAATRELAGVEALVRWRDPEGGLISPVVFIPIAEEVGLIGALGEWILEEACRQIECWLAEGRQVPVAVNLSTQQFRQAGLSGRILEIVRKRDLDPSLLEIEITESTLLHDKQAVVKELEELRDAGMRISVDDFGTGYSSLSYLRTLPVDALKIDRSFVSDIATSPDDAALAASIISMAKALRLKVIAEGVETREQYELLKGWECDVIQGYYFGRPKLPDEALADFAS